MNPWIAAARPKTLTAGAMPVFLASAWAFYKENFQVGVLIAAFLGAIALQIGTNYVNDAADFLKGADNENRLGPPRMAVLGLISPRALYIGAAVSFILAFLSGSYLISISGPIIFWIGIASIFFAITYTAGPYPLAYLGLGDLFVLIFFGIVAVLGTAYAHGCEIDAASFFLSICIGLFGVSLIAVNNLRDIPTDSLAGKKTLAVRLGDSNSRNYYALIVLLAYVFWIFIAVEIKSIWMILPILTAPLAWKNVKKCYQIEDRKEFNSLLAKSALLQMLFGILACIALVVSN
jgi:1,4-dihydroxy-2-naphthoate octaprenyltransferase